MIYNKENGKPRGYAFIEYEHERDMHCELTRTHTQTALYVSELTRILFLYLQYIFFL